jgi:hypothetical protein
MTTMRGACHCGRLTAAFSTALDPAALSPRACDCSFCRKHGAAWVSDSAGRLALTAQAASAVHEYRQGSNSARFLLCSACGVLVAVIYQDDARLYGAVNARCFDDATGLGATVPASPQRLSTEEKTARWLALWVRDVSLTVGPAD